MFVCMNMWTYVPTWTWNRVKWNSSWKFERAKRKEKKTTTEATVQNNVHYLRQWLGKKKKKNVWKPSKITTYRCTRVIYLWKTGTICFWPIAWLVECIFDLIPACTRFWLQTDRVYPFLVIALFRFSCILCLFHAGTQSGKTEKQSSETKARKHQKYIVFTSLLSYKSWRLAPA